MTKEEVKSKIEKVGIEIKSIREYGKNGKQFKVRINWKDYLKVRDLFNGEVRFIF